MQLEPRCFAWGWAKAMDNGGEGLGGVKVGMTEEEEKNRVIETQGDSKTVGISS